MIEAERRKARRVAATRNSTESLDQIMAILELKMVEMWLLFVWLIWTIWLTVQIMIGRQIRYLPSEDLLALLPIINMPIPGDVFIIAIGLLICTLVLNVIMISLAVFVLAGRMRRLTAHVGLASILIMVAVVLCLSNSKSDVQGWTFWKAQGMEATMHVAGPIVSHIEEFGGINPDDQLTTIQDRAVKLRAWELPIITIKRENGVVTAGADSTPTVGSRADLFASIVFSELETEQDCIAVGIVFMDGWSEVAWFWAETPGSSSASIDSMALRTTEYLHGWREVRLIK